jgi:type II secretory pathway component PulJ
MRISRHYSEALKPGPAAAGLPIRNSQIAIRHSSAFTLLEVVLAITIAIAILVVALAFHQQATTLRGALLEESERLAAVRQVMDRLSADLRVAPVHLQFGFTGSSNSLRFISTGLMLMGLNHMLLV